jgi:eukaryotic-like serine/threonine-protein kinase
MIEDRNTAAKCFTDEEIQLFLAYQLGRTEQDRLESHLEECPQCADRLAAAVAPESFWRESTDILRAAARQSSESGSPALSGCEETLLHVGSATDSNSSSNFYSNSDSVADSESDESNLHSSPQHNALQALLSPTDDPEMLGRIGGYEICGVVGSGGMGVVLKGWDRSLDRYVAIKILQPTFAHQSISRYRFSREAKAAAGVVHDNVIAIYGVDEHNGIPYLVMPYIKGESLERRIQRSAPLSLEDILEISLQVARGLDAAHQQGLVHRDIKPANILLPESVSRVLLTDFGLATAIDEVSLTRSNALVGTPCYMSPEQVKGETLDGRSDLFSLGCTMYAMACGCPPFRATSAYVVLRKITDQPHRPLYRLRPDLPRWFSDLVDVLLRKEPRQRWASAGGLAEALEECLAHVRQPESSRPPRLPRRHAGAGRWMQRAVWSTAGLLIVATLGWLLIGWPPVWFSSSKMHSPDTHPSNADPSSADPLSASPLSTHSDGLGQSAVESVDRDQEAWSELLMEIERIEVELNSLIEELDDESNLEKI